MPSVNLIRLLLWAKALSFVLCIQYNAFNVHKFSYYLHISREYWSNAPLPLVPPPPPQPPPPSLSSPLKHLECSTMHIAKVIESFWSNMNFSVFLAAIIEFLIPIRSISEQIDFYDFMIATTLQFWTVIFFAVCGPLLP